MKSDDITLTPTSHTNNKKRTRESPQSSLAAKKVPKAMDPKKKVGDMELGDLKAIIQDLLKEVVKKDDLKVLNAHVNQLTEDGEAMKREISALKVELGKFERKTEDLINRSRRNNLVIKGLPRRIESSWPEAVSEFALKTLGVKVNVNRAHPLGRIENNSIIAHIPADREIEEIFKNAKKLRGTGIFLERDFSPKVRATRRKLLRVRRTLIEKKVQAKISLVYDHLYVANKRIDWDDTRGLRCGNESGAEVLKAICADVNWATFEEDLKISSMATQDS